MESNKIKPSAFLVQMLSSFAIAYLTTLTGYVFAWPSYTVAILNNETSPLEAPMTSFQIDLLGSLTNVGALVATPFCGLAIDRLGRKHAAMLFGLPYVLSWSIISATKSVNLVIFAMFLAGFGAAGQVVSSVYISEIVQDSIRGGLTTSVVAGYFVGVLLSYTLGGYLEYHQVVYTHLALSVCYVVMLLFLKESPLFLIQNKREEEAAKSIAFYRRISHTSTEVQAEISKIKRLLDPRIDKILQNQENGEVGTELLNEKPVEKCKDEEMEEVSAWKFLLNSPSSKRALFSCLYLMTISIFTGAIVLQVYAEPVLQEAAPSLSANACAIAMALVFMVASVISAGLTDRFGRKPITTWSSIATGVCTLMIALQLQLDLAPPLFTVAAMFMYCFVFNLGAATTPFVLTAEAFLPEVKGLCNSITMGCMWLMNFIFLIGFRSVVRIFGLGATFYLFTGTCVMGAIYSHFFLPETKGLPVDAIQLLFYKRKRKDPGHV